MNRRLRFYMGRASVVIFAHDPCAPRRDFGIFCTKLAFILGYGDPGPQLHQREDGSFE